MTRREWSDATGGSRVGGFMPADRVVYAEIQNTA